MRKWPPQTLEPIKKCGNHKRDKIHRRNHENILKIGFGELLKIQLHSNLIFQSDPIGKVLDLSKKTFSKEIFQLLNKNLNFVPTPKVYNKHNKIERIL